LLTLLLIGFLTFLILVMIGKQKIIQHAKFKRKTNRKKRRSNGMPPVTIFYRQQVRLRKMRWSDQE
jgi:hypothetical protein